MNENIEKQVEMSPVTQTTMMRIFIVTLSVVCSTLTVIQVIAVMNISSLPIFITTKAIWLGALLWVVFAIFGWITYVDKSNKEKDLVSCLFSIALTAIAVAVVIGVFIPRFNGFTLWANAVLAILFNIFAVFAVPLVWRQSSKMQKDS